MQAVSPFITFGKVSAPQTNSRIMASVQSHHRNIIRPFIIEFLTSQPQLGNIHLSWDMQSTRLGSVVLFIILNFLAIEHVPRITNFCICVYISGCRLSLFRLCGNGFGVTPVDITNGITCAVFCFHIAHI